MVLHTPEEQTEILDASDQRRLELQDWIFLDEDGNETWPMTDEEFVCHFESIAFLNKLFVDAGDKVANFAECPIEVTGWKSYVAATDWLKSTGLPWFTDRKFISESGEEFWPFPNHTTEP